jgi:hypothetical protein
LRDSLPIDMLVSAVSVLNVAQPSSEFPDGLLNYPVLRRQITNTPMDNLFIVGSGGYNLLSC